VVAMGHYYLVSALNTLFSKRIFNILFQRIAHAGNGIINNALIQKALRSRLIVLFLFFLLPTGKFLVYCSSTINNDVGGLTQNCSLVSVVYIAQHMITVDKKMKQYTINKNNLQQIFL
jgi:hypothetical protein